MLLMAAALPATAETIHSNFGTGGSYDRSGGENTGYFTGIESGTMWEHAELFEPNQDFVVASVEIAVGFVSGQNGVIVELTESDVDGQPGAVIESFSFTNLDPFASGGSIQSATSVLHPTVQSATRYWLVARNVDPDSSLARWHINDIGDSGIVGIRENGGAWGTGGSGLRGAFRVTSVPGPGPGPDFVLDRTLPFPQGEGNVFAIAYGDDGFLWIHGRDTRRIYRLDPSDGIPQQDIHVSDDSFADIDVLDGIVYGLSEPNLFRFNAVTGEPLASLPGPAVTGGARGLTHLNGDLYASGVISGYPGEVRIGRLDPATGSVLTAFDAPNIISTSSLGRIGNTLGYLVEPDDWFGGDVNLLRVEPSTGNVVDTDVLFNVRHDADLWGLDSSNDELFVARRDERRIDVYTIVSKPSVAGDFNGNGVLDSRDIDLLTDDVHDPSLDVTGDGVVNEDDRVFWVEDLKHTWFGDADLDGEFNSHDFIIMLQGGEYFDDVPMNSTWAEGDFNGDGDFDPFDFVFVFQLGGYEKGPRPDVAVVPEPAGWLSLVLAAFWLIGIRRKTIATGSPS